MPDRIRELLNSIVEWWKKFTRKQQTIIASSALVVIIAAVILTFVLTKPEMMIIKICENAKEASTVQTLLNDAGIYNEVSDNGLTFTIKKKDSAAANILLGSNAIVTEDDRLKELLSGSLSTTEADKAKLVKEYQENKIASVLETLENVEQANVMLDIPTDDGTLIASEKESFAEVFLTLDGEMSEEQALGLARMIATGLGNKTTDNISIMDSNLNLLYSGGMGGELTTASGIMAASQLSFQQKVENKVKGNIKNVLLGTGQYQSVEVGLNLPLNFDKSNTSRKEYDVGEGRDEGYLSSDRTYDEETTSGNAGVPGTDANGEDGNTYMLNDGEQTQQTISDSSRDYNVNETITNTESGMGDIIYETASLGVTLRTYIKYDEDVLKNDGTLEGTTFEEYRAQIESQGAQRQEVEDEVIDVIAKATGIDAERISVIAYQEPLFIPSEGSGRTFSDYLEILLAVLIFALLGFVVFMSTRKEKAPELEPELSVETLLQTTKENEEENLEDIGFKEKSEARVLIEKFVEEKPEAVASLLRNWLNEDWE
ncbi:MAG: flagellar biosynthesis protein [Eubacterium sp.]|nr:flagellar biosynthesis protein [Eubacterium sp.]